MRCPDCKRDMLLLLASYVCDHCDGKTEETYYPGYIVYHPERMASGGVFYVFRKAVGAARWRSEQNLQRCHIRKVYSLDPFVWTTSRTDPKTELAETPFTVFPDHRYEPKPNRAFLVPVKNEQIA